MLATKVNGPMEDVDDPNFDRGISAYKVRKHVNDSLTRLQTDRIDLYQVHHIDRSITLEEFWGTFEKLVADGKVLYMGSSNFPAWGLAKFQTAALQRGFLGLISDCLVSGHNGPYRFICDDQCFQIIVRKAL